MELATPSAEEPITQVAGDVPVEPLPVQAHTTAFPRAHASHKINSFFAFIFGSDPVPKTITNNLDACLQSLLLRWFNGWFCDPSPQSFGALTLTKSHAFMRNTCQ